MSEILTHFNPSSRAFIAPATLATSPLVTSALSSGSRAASDSSDSQSLSTSSRCALTLACSLARLPSTAFLQTKV